MVGKGEEEGTNDLARGGKESEVCKTIWVDTLMFFIRSSPLPLSVFFSRSLRTESWVGKKGEGERGPLQAVSTHLPVMV